MVQGEPIPKSAWTSALRASILCGAPLKTLADVIHPFPAFNRMLGESLNQLAAKVAAKGEHHEQYAGQH